MKTMAVAALFGLITLSGCFVETSPERQDPYGSPEYRDSYPTGHHDSYHTDHYYDPVCGIAVYSTSPWRHSYEGRTYYFHDEECRNRFRHSPHAYVNPGDHRYDAR